MEGEKKAWVILKKVLSLQVLSSQWLLIQRWSKLIPLQKVRTKMHANPTTLARWTLHLLLSPLIMSLMVYFFFLQSFYLLVTTMVNIDILDYTLRDKLLILVWVSVTTTTPSFSSPHTAPKSQIVDCFHSFACSYYFCVIVSHF